MDMRKVQLTGKSTYIVTLPKKWAISSGLVAGSLLTVSYQDDGSLVITPPFCETASPKKRLRFDGSLDELKRDIIGSYIMGVPGN